MPLSCHNAQEHHLSSTIHLSPSNMNLEDTVDVLSTFVDPELSDSLRRIATWVTSARLLKDSILHSFTSLLNTPSSSYNSILALLLPCTRCCFSSPCYGVPLVISVLLWTGQSPVQAWWCASASLLLPQISLPCHRGLRGISSAVKACPWEAWAN